MRHYLVMSLVVIASLMLFVWVSLAQYADSSVRLVAENAVNLRAYPGTDTDILGQMEVGVPYVLLGQHEIFPWYLVGDPVSLQAIGWVFRDIVQVSGDVSAVPYYDVVVTLTDTPTAITVVPDASVLPTTFAPSLTPTFLVAGIVQNEINVRYGPGVDYARLGVAQAGERFQITGYHTQFPWVQVRYEQSPTGFAWIASSLLEIDGNIYRTEAISTTQFNLPTLTPTPAIVQSVAGLSGESQSVSPELASLGNSLFNLALNLQFDPATNQFGSLYLLDLESDEAISYGGNVAYSGTSVAKLSILVTLYGILNEPPREQLAADIANTMICSNNAATNRLLAAIGEGDEWAGTTRVTAFLETLGLTNSFMLAPYVADPANPPIPPAPIPVPETEVDQAVAYPEPYNQVTVQDMGQVLGAVYQCAYDNRGPLIDLFSEGTYEPRECRQMLHVMVSNNVDSLLKTGVPDEIRVAHKHGWINDTHMNAGVFFTEGGDYVVVMALHSNRLGDDGTRFLNFAASQPLFSESSRQIYNYFNPTRPNDITREGFIPEAPGCDFAGTPLISDLMQLEWDE